MLNSKKTMIALTFDDGPNKYTESILDIFATYGGKGTFFVVGDRIDERTETVKRIVEEGHEIAGHGWNHCNLTELGAEELKKQIADTRAKIYDVTETDAVIIRPPYGAYDEHAKNICADLGIAMVTWSVDTMDWKNENADAIYDVLVNETKGGDIVLCHNLHEGTALALKRAIPELLKKEYRLVSVSELLSYSDRAVSAGNVYERQ